MIFVHVRKLHIPPSRWTQSQAVLAERRIIHSLFHWNTLTSPELQEQVWMLCKNAASMTIGTSMGQEICLTLGQVSFSLLNCKRNFQTGCVWSGWRLTKRQVTSRPDHLWPELWIQMGRNAKLTERHEWPEDYEEFISLTLRTRNSKKPSRMLVRNWKRRWLLLCLARQARHVSMGWPVAKPMRSNQNLRAFWKPVNPQDCVWKNLYRIITRTTLQERVTIHCNLIIWFTNLFLCLKSWRYPQQKQQWIKNGRN